MTFSLPQVLEVTQQIGVDWTQVTFTPEDVLMGMQVELEHGTRDQMTNVTNDDPVLTAKIALAHLNEFPDYYQRLKKMEAEGIVLERTPLVKK